jgi:hypothetical protein
MMKDEAFCREQAREAWKSAARSPDVETRMAWLDIAEVERQVGPGSANAQIRLARLFLAASCAAERARGEWLCLARLTERRGLTGPANFTQILAYLTAAP